MKTSRIYSLLVILALLALVLIFSKDDHLFLGRKKNEFSFNNYRLATEIHISNSENSTALSFSNNTWVTNNSYEVDKEKIDVLFGSLKNLKMQAPVSKKLENELNAKLDTEGTRFTLKSNSKTIYHITFIEHQGRTIGRIANNSPCYLSINAYKHLELWQLIEANPNYWRNNLLLNYSAKQIGAVTIRFTLQPEIGFTLVNSPDGLVLFNQKKEIIKDFSAENASDYLHFFSGITYEPANNKYYLKSDELKLFELSILTTDQKEVEISGYKLYSAENHNENHIIFAGVINKQDTVFLRYNNFDPIVLSLDFFLKK